MSSPESRPWPLAAESLTGPDLVEQLSEQHRAASTAELKVTIKGPDRPRVGLTDEDRTQARELTNVYLRLKAEADAEPQDQARQQACAQAHEDLVLLLNLAMGNKNLAEQMAKSFIEHAK